MMYTVKHIVIRTVWVFVEIGDVFHVLDFGQHFLSDLFRYDQLAYAVNQNTYYISLTEYFLVFVKTVIHSDVR